jgi:hypothetical protein
MPPTMLINSLETVRKRVKLLGVVYGIGIVLAAAVGLLLATVLIDYILNLPAAPRLFIILASLAAVVYSTFRWVVKPMLARLSLSDVAGRLEQAFPEFNDRLRSTVDFVRSDVPGSDAMKQRVVGEATSLAGRLDLGKAVVAAPAWYSMGAGIGAILLASMLAVLTPHYASIALSRLLNPFHGQAWPKRVQIDLLGDVPTRVPVGQRLDIRMKLARGDATSRKARIFTQYDGGPPQPEFMIRGADGTYAASLDTRVDTGKQAATLKIWMESGDDQVYLPAVTVVPRLQIKSVEAELSPPPYVTNQQTTTVNLAAAPAVVADGSRVTLKVNFNKPLAKDSKVEILPASQEMAVPRAQWSSAGGMTMSGTWLARQSLRFHIRATDTDAFSNNALEEYEVIVRPDQSPSVQIENPRRNEERTPVSVVPLQGLAEDDYGIQGLKLVVERSADKRRWEINLIDDAAATNGATVTRAEGSADRLRLRAAYQWDLAQLKDANLKAGDVLEYYLLARDNFALDGQTHPEVPSGRLRIAIISQEDLAARVIDDLRQAKNQILGVKNSEDRTRQETTGVANDTKQKDQLDAGDKAALERLTNQQATSASQTKQISAKVDALRDRLAENKSPSQELSDIARDVTNDLNQAAENPMKEATSSLSKANQPQAKPDARNEALAKAAQTQQQAADQLQQAMDRMANIGSLAQTIENIRKLLEEQQQVSRETRDIGKENLGKTPDQMKPEDRDRLNKNAEAQSKLGDKTAKAMDAMQKMADQMSKSDPASSEAMKKAAQTGSQQQVSQNQQKAAQQAKQNQQAQAQAAQKQVELGLEMMLNQLREAERAKLAELQKKLEELQNQVANLIRRQAGHNLDNLAIQGPDKLAKVDSAVIVDLLVKAEREKDKLPPVPQLTQLSSAQEQTERNTRDIAKTAEALPNGAEPASHLTRAAGRMERAIVSLREKKLPEAYDPPQVEALAELQSAKKIVDEQKNKVDEQIQDADKEAIRQKYVKIKDDQQKLNDETNRIDKTRGPDAALARAEAVRLGQLPGEQGKLSERVNAISQDLVSVGSTVYIWANKDIVDSMGDVKQDLGKQQTGVPTQAEQTRIIAQLDAMIRNLAIKPKESKFAQEGGGGGGGNGGPQLPTEAELRLLQDLQRAVNGSTKTIDQEPTKDKPKLMALGNRQGELRNLLDQTLQKSSRGQIKLGPEPDNKDQLPEEAKKEDVENQELEKNLLNDVPAEEKNSKQAGLIGDRMARSRQRLAMNNDAGKVTQMIQDRIIEDMDYLIDQARQQQAQTRNQPQGKKGQQMAQPKPGEQQAQNNGQKQSQPKGSQPAAQSLAPGGAARNEDLSKKIEESAAEWGQVTPRLRDAVIEGASENVVQEYRKLVEEYYRSVAEKGTGSGQ